MVDKPRKQGQIHVGNSLSPPPPFRKQKLGAFAMHDSRVVESSVSDLFPTEPKGALYQRRYLMQSLLGSVRIGRQSAVAVTPKWQTIERATAFRSDTR